MARDSLPPGATLASLIGAVLYGRRQEDKKARTKMAALGASGFLIFFAYESVSFGQEWVRHEWTSATETQKEMIVALKAVSKEIHDLLIYLRDGK